MKERTICPYCGTANLVKNQLQYIDEYGTHVFKCQMCGQVFTDLAIKQEQETSTNQKIEDNGKKREKNNS